VEGELRRIAHRYMRMERQGHTLQTTALVNEAYLKLARLMRHILVVHARELCRGKRGGGAHVLPLDEGLVFSPTKSAALVALDDALNELAGFDPRKAQIVELRYFGGMSVEEAAESLGVHPNTVIRDWGLAKVWLKRELSVGQASWPGVSSSDVHSRGASPLWTVMTGTIRLSKGARREAGSEESR
jgi:DNA-directed RNA polymerase specialized sigma24 family protein